HGELPLPSPTIQYIHHPFLNRWQGDHYKIDSWSGSILNKLLTKYINGTIEAISQTTILTNSEWSARQLQIIYGINPKVVYPPVHTELFEPLSWNKRENGFVTVGRIAPDKKTLDACHIVNILREKGYDVHLHLVGPKGNDESFYREVQEYAKAHRWITLEGQISQRELSQLIESHRWRLHMKPWEHFGMVVAEFVAGGMIPFVPNSGGQTEIVNNNQLVVYESIGEAIDQISSLLDSPTAVSSIKSSFPDPDKKFSVERFQNEIRREINSSLS
ncbi:MAG: glycosyltransferase family 4 protein, partial [Halobacteriaceae archaeon]